MKYCRLCFPVAFNIRHPTDVRWKTLFKWRSAFVLLIFGNPKGPFERIPCLHLLIDFILRLLLTNTNPYLSHSGSLEWQHTEENPYPFNQLWACLSISSQRSSFRNGIWITMGFFLCQTKRKLSWIRHCKIACNFYVSINVPMTTSP